ncbi:MAG: MFS transporter [Candidatus Nanohaloarchaea archaeon]
MKFFDFGHRLNLQEEVNEIYLHRFLLTLALGTVTIFLPLYLYDLGMAVQSIFLFYTVYYATFVVTSLPAAFLASRIGYKRTSLASSPFILGFYLVLRSFETAGVWLYPTAALGGLGFIVYWIGMNSEMARNSHDDTREEETGYFFSMPLLATVIAPIFGGLLLSLYGFKLLFLVALGLIAVSYTPFLFSEEHYEGMGVELRKVFGTRNAADFLTYYFVGVISITKKVVWPLYLALIVKGALNIGGAGSIRAFGGAVVSILIGRISTRANRGRILLYGGAAASLTYLAMSAVATPVQAFAVSLVNGMLMITVRIPIYTEAMENAEAADILEYFSFREIGLCSGRITVLLTGFYLFSTFPLEKAFLYAFIISTVTLYPLIFFARRMDLTNT